MQQDAPSRGPVPRAASPRLWFALFAFALVAFIGSLALLGAVLSDAWDARGERPAAPGLPAPSASLTGEPSATPPVSTPLPTGAAAPAALPTARRTPAAAPAMAPLPSPAAIVEDRALRDAIEDALAPDVDRFGIVVRRLRDGRGVAINPERPFYAASLFKLPLLYEAERRRALGVLDFESIIQLTEEDIGEDLGTIGDLEVGEDGTVAIRAAVEAMVTRSDNASAVAMLHLLGGAAVDETLAALGLTGTSVNTRDLPTTAGDMAVLAEAIASGRGVGDEAAAGMRLLLLGQLTRSGIPAGVPGAVPVGNKTGNWTGATHDVAFVDAPGGRYVIAVLSENDWDWAPIERVSRLVFEAMTRD